MKNRFNDGRKAGTYHSFYDRLRIGIKPRQDVTVNVTREDGSTFSFTTTARLDGAIDVTYYENGGILLTVMRRLMKA